VYGFYGECMRKYGNANVWRYFTDMFDYLPLSALIDTKIFAVYGGISSQIISLDQIRVMDRFHDIQIDGAMTDLLWSDPDPDRDGFTPSTRGPGQLFGGDIVQQFTRINELDHIVRAKQLCMDGYQILFNKLSTVWSAPNFCYRCGNVAAIIEITEDMNRIYNTFIAAPDSERSDKGVSDRQKEVPDYFA